MVRDASALGRALFALTGTGLALGVLLLMNQTPTPIRAAPDELFVSPAGSGDCSQAAPCDLKTALALVADGDTVYLAGGDYVGSGGAVVTVTHAMTLYGGWDGAPTGPVVRDPLAYPSVLDGEGARRVIHLAEFVAPVIEGLVIVNGNAANAPFNSGRGGGIHGLNATPRIAFNIIRNNVAGPSSEDGLGYGGGIYLFNAYGIVITANQVISNTANGNGYGYGGGIFLKYADAARVVNNGVLSNTASITVPDSTYQGYGGGVAVLRSQNVVMAGNEIAHNTAYRGEGWTGSRGGGVYCSNSPTLTFSANVVRFNVVNANATGGTGGGIEVRSCDRAVLDHNLFEGNATSGRDLGSGGALYAYAAHGLDLTANRFVGNQAYWGGGLCLGHKTRFTMTNNLVAENIAGYEGGGMAFEAWSTEPVTGTLVHNTFAANDRGSGNGRIAIHLNDSNVTLVLTNNLIYSHTYGIYAVIASTARLEHTFFYANDQGDTDGPGNIVNVNPIIGQDPRLTLDYHLSAYSPAIDAGLSLPWLTADIDGDPRPLDSGYDAGADEAEHGPVWRLYLPVLIRH